MCGIIGYIGYREAVKIILDGLECLEYRGYDSTGLAAIENGKLLYRKNVGRLSVLKDSIDKDPITANIGIGHNRWATHGKPSDINAHPHLSSDGLISVIHNGIIENYLELKAALEAKGVEFVSETDTEVVAHLIREKYKGDLLSAVSEALSEIRGAYALCVLCESEPGRIIAAKLASPLIIGFGDAENFVASDSTALAAHTRRICNLNDRVIADVTAESVHLYDLDLKPLELVEEHIPDEWTQEAVALGEYSHFMLKEIHEQPQAIRNAAMGKLGSKDGSVAFDGFSFTKEEYKKLKRIDIVACGTAYFAGVFGKYLIEKHLRIPVEACIASEFRYKNPIVGEGSLVIAISQSGETMDTLESLKLAKARGAKTLAITNVLGSQIDRAADYRIYTMAGPEIAVASTKAYSTQVEILYLLALYFGSLSESMPAESVEALTNAAMQAPDAVSYVLGQEKAIEQATEEIFKSSRMFFIGRGADYCASLEGALKLKEISYIHAEAYPSGELKHGPIALIEEGTPIVALATQPELYDKALSNIKEVKARGAKVLLIARDSAAYIAREADISIMIGEMEDDAAILPAVCVMQLLSYYTALKLGRDVDKPRNLAKSVTVE
ncbi:MAG: glutamine--fructose-6-phosphate transaminase (isomerizing) [Eubacteriaceae bacterium]|nr:glutamine--fructose-6-phosphate transaminase (isomerizing) [Eubacteriaceae bacterium]